MREGIDRSRINAVLLLTDGRNEDGERDLDGLLRELTSEDEHRIVRVFTIGYGVFACVCAAAAVKRMRTPTLPNADGGREARPACERVRDRRREHPDCRAEFISAFETMANLATKSGVEGTTHLKIHTPLAKLDKAGIVKLGAQVGVDFSQTHSCYDPGPGGRPEGDRDLARLPRRREDGVRKSGRPVQ